MSLDCKAFKQEIYGIILKIEPVSIDEFDMTCRTITQAHSL